MHPNIGYSTIIQIIYWSIVELEYSHAINEINSTKQNKNRDKNFIYQLVWFCAFEINGVK